MKQLLCVLMFGMVFGQAELTSRVYEFTANHDEIINIADIIDEDLQIYFLEIMDAEFSNQNLGAQHPTVTIKASVPSSSSLDQQRATITIINKEEPTYSSSGYSYYPAKQVFTTNELKIENSNNSSHDPMTFKIVVTAEFPEEDTGYIEEGFDYCINEGANLISSPCRDAIYILDTLPSEIADNLTGVITEAGACSQINPGQWVGSQCDIGADKGYWFISDNMDACFNYTCTEN